MNVLRLTVLPLHTNLKQLLKIWNMIKLEWTSDRIENSFYLSIQQKMKMNSIRFN